MQRIKTALCSYGMSGKLFHAPFLHLHKGFDLYAAWERQNKLIRSDYPEVISYASYEEMLMDESIELMVINTPNYTHFDYAKKALLAGKHIVVEKPFCITVAECDELIVLAAEKKKLISVYQNRRWDSDFKTVQKIIEEGRLGRIAEAEIHLDRFNLELSPKLHKELPGPGAGILYDLGPHLIDQALHLFGMPQAIFADLAILRPVSKVDDYFELLLYYTDMRVRLKSGYLVREALPAYIIHGHKGSFIKPRADVQEDMLKAGQMPVNEDWGTEPESGQGILHTEIDGEIKREQIRSLQGNYQTYYNMLYRALTENEPLPVTAAEGRNVIYIIEKALESFEKKCIIPV